MPHSVFSRLLHWVRGLFASPPPPIRETRVVEQHEEVLFSRFLHRDVQLSLFLPEGISHPSPWPLVFFNDGQDMEAVGMLDTLDQLISAKRIPPLILVGIHANEHRMREYGVVHVPDYKGRGDRAERYRDFLLRELLPSLYGRFPQVVGGPHLIAGFSLGGLSAFDLACRHSNIFSGVGVFSGSFWWRSKPFDATAPDRHLIIPSLLKQGKYKLGLRFWFQAGTHDETNDRNGNGVIDAIDDTLTVVEVLEELGYNRDTEIRYVEVEGGEHNPYTWGTVLADFLEYQLSPKKLAPLSR